MSVTKTEGRHLPELDGIRGLAILGVLCSHVASVGGILNATAPAPWERAVFTVLIPLWGGVDLFFVLSGFLITGILLRTREANNYFRSFYARRMLRIFPIYYLTITLSLLLGRFLGEVGRQLPAWTSWKVAYFLYLQNWPVFWHGQKVMGGLWGVYWSLAVEEQFYFVWPLLIFLCSEKTVIRICLWGLPFAILLRAYLCYAYFGAEFGLLQLTTSRMEGLLLGSACAVFMHAHKKPLPRLWIVASTVAGASLFGAIAIFHNRELVATGKWMSLFGTTSYALLSLALVAASQHPFPLLRRFLTLTWLRSMGKYSYGMYVYHIFLVFALRRYLVNGRVPTGGSGIPYAWPVKVLAFLAEILVVYLFAKVSYELVEKRFLQLKRRFQPKGSTENSSLLQRQVPVG